MTFPSRSAAPALRKKSAAAAFERRKKEPAVVSRYVPGDSGRNGSRPLFFAPSRRSLIPHVSICASSDSCSATADPRSAAPVRRPRDSSARAASLRGGLAGLVLVSHNRCVQAVDHGTPGLGRKSPWSWWAPVCSVPARHRAALSWQPDAK